MTPRHIEFPTKQYSLDHMINIIGTMLFGVMMWIVSLVILCIGHAVLDDVLAFISFALIGAAAVGYGIAELT